ncbi:cytidine deaminase [Cellulophaga lytica]|uniref:CMP/dCMP deaminase zinc-binding protein n=1 Tax=Cellulophaga lytica (strain ATCC 23178 / DSM 7489 / JCM 8516 / NBRC 14961 / NCIMB 1423 / VKM B-1433 / Cy l20) TaxID=867900 RepID=F0REB6_CELLC|nr:cytidine deaminase [Cellulophaga lytica]ADY29891.1 CMP/dCMP deaminase zinc-binding protein [Cellulophaga lytica DSM 7489]AIM60891.1 cytidine deaminase [Cellulophaga lytica]WQG75943.1 cytidine deaminase [Cellulophaga lytica]
MKKHTLSFDMSVYDSINELPETDKKIMLKAVEARNNAYAPYSSFFVGAAVLLENGKIVLGNNQENAAYPSGLCAERVAIYQAAAIYPNVKICSVAISATSKNYKVLEPAAPCGNCRQSMIEYEQKQKEPMTLLLMGEEGTVVKCNSISDILPLAFSNSFL